MKCACAHVGATDFKPCGRCELAATTEIIEMLLNGLARLGRDAELRRTQSGEAVSNLSLAYNYGMKDQQTGNRPAQWVEAALWGRQAEALQQYLLKGTQVVVALRDVHLETFQRQDGSSGTKLVGTVLQLELAGSRQDSGEQQQQQQRPPQQQRPQQAPQQRPAPPAQDYDSFDDDTPF
ncbi:ssDNA binding protein [Pseudomonas phage Persinger]|uniref:SsDNA binding protein n=1 Tax=Pseudomonas phage Persinger TaxID=2749430 RepID=A0A7D7F5B9_9CAUD|nr:ssDNA binding protein [Pseudomonas phage Persinger]QMP19192.1 ssDNA binding protein [Pseudomonas phage Persinger]